MTNYQRRTMLHTLSVIRDIIDMSNTLKKERIVISSNFLKVFDRADWNFIFSVLRKFGYVTKFILMIQVAYINIQTIMKQMASYLSFLH